MKILVLNCGSSSLKFQLIETSAEQMAADSDVVLAHGSVEKIGSADASLTYQQKDGEKQQEKRQIPTAEDAIRAAFDRMTGPGGVLQHVDDIDGVGHRVVHGGEHFRQSVLIDDEVIRQIEAASDLAPLHNPHNLSGILVSRKLLPKAKNVAVFDTAFHQTMPETAFLYALPYDYYTRERVRRYGFHGTSHRYVSQRFAHLQGKTRADFKLISCHLGNGCSVCAIDRGKSVDTSMGLTPLEGLVMGTRCGDLDPGAVIYLVEHAGIGIEALSDILNEKSGLAGVSGLSNDMRDLLQAREKGNGRARLAVDLFCYRVKKYLGAYLAAMNGADAILFTGGIGENAPAVRAQICANLDALGVAIDEKKNADAVRKAAGVSPAGSRVAVWVVPTDEELLIARDTLCCIQGLPHA